MPLHLIWYKKDVIFGKDLQHCRNITYYNSTEYISTHQRSNASCVNNIINTTAAAQIEKRFF